MLEEAKRKLNSALIKHYQCFNTERFTLDEVTEDYAYVASSIEDECPIRLCRYIAKFIYKYAKTLDLEYPFVYVGAWTFSTAEW